MTAVDGQKEQKKISIQYTDNPRGASGGAECGAGSGHAFAI